MFLDLKNAFQSTFWDVLSASCHMFISQKKNLPLKNHSILTPSDPWNTKILESQNIFWDMTIWYEGHLEHPKKCSGMHFWGLETCSNTKFLKSKKNFFRKFGGQKKCKITFLGCGTKKRFRVKILIDYIYPIDEIWDHLEYGNILEKSILRLLGPFLAFF